MWWGSSHYHVQIARSAVHGSLMNCQTLRDPSPSFLRRPGRSPWRRLSLHSKTLPHFHGTPLTHSLTQDHGKQSSSCTSFQSWFLEVPWLGCCCSFDCGLQLLSCLRLGSDQLLSAHCLIPLSCKPAHHHFFTQSSLGFKRLNVWLLSPFAEFPTARQNQAPLCSLMTLKHFH